MSWIWAEGNVIWVGLCAKQRKFQIGKLHTVTKYVCVSKTPPSHYFLYNFVKNEPMLIFLGIQNHEKTFNFNCLPIPMSTTHEKCHHKMW